MEEMIILKTSIDFVVDQNSLDIPMPIIIIHGNQRDGKPVRVDVHGYLPYMYLEIIQKTPKPDVDPADLKTAIQHGFTKGMCLGVEKVEGKSIYGYQKEKSSFYKILFNSPLALKPAKAYFEAGISVKGRGIRFKTYESNYPHILRFMSDVGLTGMSYMRIKEYSIIDESGETYPDGMEKGLAIRTHYEYIEPIPVTGEYMRIPPLKMLSFDIEAVTSGSGFPVPSKDPVIQIGNTVQRFGLAEQRRCIFCLKETAEIPGAEVYWFETEREMLLAWHKFWHEEDPDIISGYNIKSYDFFYLLDRAEALGLDKFAILGRSNFRSKVISKQQSSSSFGAFNSKEIVINGRIVIDMHHVIRRDYKLRSYSLNAVSFHFLGEQKEDVPYTAMYELQTTGPDTRRRIASYCLHDTYLPLRLIDKLNVVVNHAELARATHVPIDYFSTRGSAIKVLAQIYWEAHRAGFFVPDMEVAKGDDGFEGAFVMDPIRGFYRDPIAVLDFSSLYPSIMISKNLCYTTYISENAEGLPSITSPVGDCFLSADVKEGLLPRILRNLLSARKEAKRQLKETTDPAHKRALDGRQYALKICANSIYGFTGAPAGQLPCIPISRSTTAFGREMIMKTKNLIEGSFMAGKSPDGKEVSLYNAKVIYGDTDSVMVHFVPPEGAPPCGLEESFALAARVSALVTCSFEKPVSLEFEKVYCPYLLMNKKRYAGLVYTRPEKADKIDTKGIETVRRDNCELVKNVIQVCLDKILYDRNIDAAIDHVKETVRKLYTEQIDLSQLVISKTFTKENYANKQAHTELAARLRKRGLAVEIGDRIPYVIVKGDKKSLASDRSEDPVYVLENSLPIDLDYYIEQQLSKPIHRLFEPVMDNVSSLFSGAHTKVITRSTVVNGPLNSFMKPVDECIGCRAPGAILCTRCTPEFPKHLIKLQQLYNSKTAEFNACWTECQRCQGSIVNEVLCINRICPIWYKRLKVKKELLPLQKKLTRLQELSW